MPVGARFAEMKGQFRFGRVEKRPCARRLQFHISPELFRLFLSDELADLLESATLFLRALAHQSLSIHSVLGSYIKDGK